MKLTDIDKKLRERRSVRAFLPKSIPIDLLENILTTARHAPSGGNLQPGNFHILTGDPLQKLSHELIAAHQSGREPVSEYSYFPNPLSKLLKQRQFKAGYTLYDALGIDRKDHAAREKQFAKNYRFFDAPVGIVVTIDRNMGKGCFMDMGMAIMNLFTSAHGYGVSATGIGALANYADVVHQFLSLPEKEMVVCGIALGYEDTNHPVNTVDTEREPLENFTTFYGFEKK